MFCEEFRQAVRFIALEPFKNNLYIFAILPDAFGFAGSLHTFRDAPYRQFPKSPRDISRNL